MCSHSKACSKKRTYAPSPAASETSICGSPLTGESSIASNRSKCWSVRMLMQFFFSSRRIITWLVAGLRPRIATPACSLSCRELLLVVGHLRLVGGAQLGVGLEPPLLQRAVGALALHLDRDGDLRDVEACRSRAGSSRARRPAWSSRAIRRRSTAGCAGPRTTSTLMSASQMLQTTPTLPNTAR